MFREKTAIGSWQKSEALSSAMCVAFGKEKGV